METVDLKETTKKEALRVNIVHDPKRLSAGKGQSGPPIPVMVGLESSKSQRAATSAPNSRASSTNTFFFLKICILLCVCACLHICMLTSCMPHAHRGPAEHAECPAPWSVLRLKSVSLVRAQNAFSLLLSHLSSPVMLFVLLLLFCLVLIAQEADSQVEEFAVHLLGGS